MSFPETDEEAPARLDAFHGGRFHLRQPVGSGFRAGLDAMLLTACVSPDRAGSAADIGAGTGAVGFGAASRAPNLSVTLVENDPAMVALLRASLDEPSNRDLAARLGVAALDILAGREARHAAGLRDAQADLVLTNPPFFPGAYRQSADPSRRAALVAPDPVFLPRWLRACAALLGRGGTLVAILRPSDLPMAAEALAGRAGGLTVLPVHTRAGPARRILLRATAGSRADLSIVQALDLSPAGDPDGTLVRAISSGSHLIDFA